MEEGKYKNYISVRGFLDTAMFQLGQAEERLHHFLSEGRTRISQKEVDNVRAYLKKISIRSKNINVMIAEFEMFVTERFEDDNLETVKKFSKDDVVKAVGIDEF